MADRDTNQNVVVRQDWVEPEVTELSVMETHGFPGRGADGGSFLDCTRS